MGKHKDRQKELNESMPLGIAAIQMAEYIKCGQQRTMAEICGGRACDSYVVLINLGDVNG